MDPRSTALVVIDVQNGFVNANSAGAVPTIVRMTEAWKALGAPIVFARFHNRPGSPYERISGWTRLRSAEEQAIVPELQPYLTDAALVIDKGTSSVFGVDGGQALTRAGWTDLVFVGIDTDSCVYDSAVDAYHAGFRPWIAVDACASSGGEEYHAAALLLARRNLGQAQLITSSDAIEQLTTNEGALS